MSSSMASQRPPFCTLCKGRGEVCTRIQLSSCTCRLCPHLVQTQDLTHPLPSPITWSSECPATLEDSNVVTGVSVINSASCDLSTCVALCFYLTVKGWAVVQVSLYQWGQSSLTPPVQEILHNAPVIHNNRTFSVLGIRIMEDFLDPDPHGGCGSGSRM